MLGRAGGRERSGNGEKRHLAALEAIVGLHLLRAVLRHLHKSGDGQPVALADRHLVLRPSRSESVSPSTNRFALSTGADRNSVLWGESVCERVEYGRCRTVKKKQ